MANLRLPDHSHCVFCGEALPFGQDYCNDECRKNEADRIAREKRRDYMFYGITGAIILALFIIRFLTK